MYLNSKLFIFITFTQALAYDCYVRPRKLPNFKTNLSKKSIIDSLSKLSYFFEDPSILRRPKHQSHKELDDLIFAELTKNIKLNDAGNRKPLSQLSFNEIVGMLRKLTQPLRVGPVGLSDRSGELNDPLAPGKHHSSESSEVDEEPKHGIMKKPWPNYSWYDFWTYKKPYITGDCPSDSVKVENVCIQTPPH